MALSDEKREQIKSLLATGISKNDVAKKCGVSWASVDSISKEEPDKIENFREHKRMQFVDRIWENMEDALDLGHMKVKLAKDGTEKLNELIETIYDSDGIDTQKAHELSKAIEASTTIPLSHISTYIGTLYDKQALMVTQTMEAKLKKLIPLLAKLNFTEQEIEELLKELA